MMLSNLGRSVGGCGIIFVCLPETDTRTDEGKGSERADGVNEAETKLLNSLPAEAERSAAWLRIEEIYDSGGGVTV
jgi:hypothetical protein